MNTDQKARSTQEPLGRRMLRSISKTVVASKYINRWLILFIDTVITTVTTSVTYLVIGYFISSSAPSSTYFYVALVCWGISFMVFIVLGTYKGILRYTTLQEMWKLGVAILIKSLIETCLFLVLRERMGFTINWKRIILTELLCLVLSMGLLVFMRVFLVYIYNYSLSRLERNRMNVLVFGVDERSVAVNQYLSKFRNGKYNVAGFLLMSDAVENHSLGGKKIYYVYTNEYLLSIVKKHKIRGFVFSSEARVAENRDTLVNFAIKQDIKIFVFPAFTEIDDASGVKAQMREIRIEDLLGRDELNVDMSDIRHFLEGKCVMVTGAAGSIGSELCRLISRFNISHLVMLDNAETPTHNLMLDFEGIVKAHRAQLKMNTSDAAPQDTDDFADRFSFYICDVRNKRRLEAAFKKWQPQVIFHAAAYKHVPMMENNPTEAVRVNVLGTINVANLAIKYGAEKMIMVSTDKAVNPTNVMGASKRIAEIYTQSTSRAILNGEIEGKTKFITTRFGNVLGSNGSVIPHFKEQIAAGGPVTVTDKDIVRYFMSIPEACRLVLEAAALGKGYEIFAFDMGKPVKIADLAEEMIRLAGYEPGVDIKIEFTGLRPGEKLYEELLNNKENTIPTENKKIFVAKVREYSYTEIKNKIDYLITKASMVEPIDTVKAMKDLVPEFKSKNSVYEQLDQLIN